MEAVKKDTGKPRLGINYFRGWAILYDVLDKVKLDKLEPSSVVWSNLRFNGLKALAEGNTQTLVITLVQIASIVIGDNTIPAEKIVSAICAKGAEKYSLFNYRNGFKWSRLWDSLNRHLTSYLEYDKSIDEEFGVEHRMLVVSNCLMLLEHIVDNLGENDLKEETTQ